MSASEDPKALPDFFGHAHAVARIGGRRLRRDLDAGDVIRLRRGWYRKASAVGDEDLIEIALASPAATLCLTSALAHHDLTDEIPASTDAAIPRGNWAPSTSAPVTWHRFDRATFEVGRGELVIADGLTIGLFDAERSIVDAFRLAHREGTAQANEALRRWLRNGGQPSVLLRTAASFPKALPRIRAAMEVLL